MKKWAVPAQGVTWPEPKNPDRTAYREATGFLNFDRVYQEWPNRASMAKTIRMQQAGVNFASAWKACVALSGNEGY